MNAANLKFGRTWLLAGVLFWGISPIADGPGGKNAAIGQSLPELVESSGVIALARRVNYVPDPPPATPQPTTRLRALTARDLVRSGLTGTFAFEIEARVVGEVASPMLLRTDRLSYTLYGDPNLRLENTSRCLLFLRTDPLLGVVATSASIPFIPAAAAAQFPANMEGNSTLRLGMVEHVLASSLADQVAGPSSAYFLRQSRNPMVLQQMRAHVDDPNLYLRHYALSCMAENQLVEAIPKILELEPKLSGMPRGTIAPFYFMLGQYDTPAAVEYLNPLLIDRRSSGLRLQAARALYRILDERTGPYWIQALRDPEQPLVMKMAYDALYRLYPEIDPPKQVRTLFPSEQEISLIELWWAREGAAKFGPATRPAR